tara:strand:- start:997 stop:1422 length:426 start_codon:yes stop_codon:yes gene_type:complete
MVNFSELYNVGWAHVAADPNVLPKAVDANWRRNRQWILLKAGIDGAYHPVFSDDDKRYQWFFHPVETPYFAMRIGDIAMRVLVLSAKGNLRKPEIVNVPGLDDPFTIDGTLFPSGPHQDLVRQHYELFSQGDIRKEDVTCV